MKKLILFTAVFLFASLAQAQTGIWLPNLGAYATGTASSGHNGIDISGSITATNPSVSATGSAVPSDATFVGAKDSLGNLVGLLTGQQTMANSLACVLPSDQSAIPVNQSGTWNVTNITGTVSLPTGAATAAKQPALGTAGTASSDVITVQGITGMTALKVDGSGSTQPVSGTVTANQGGTWTVQPGNTANTVAWLVTGTGGTFPAIESGTWNVGLNAGTNNIGSITDITGTISLPTGAATAANQSTANTALATIATNTGKQPINSAGSFSQVSETTTAATATAPVNAVSVMIQGDSSNTDCIRWAIGTTATTTAGMVLQPGQDTGLVAEGASVSIIACSGTQKANIQWVTQ